MFDRGKQIELAFGRGKNGGARPGAGRPKKDDAGVSHLARGKLASRYPVHVTIRIEKGIRSLRGKKMFAQVKHALTAGRERFGFRLVHYAVMSNHLHLIVEAKDKSALSRGMQGLSIRIARAINRVCARTGRVFKDRYHAHILKTPTEVRSALLYVLNNFRRHAGAARPRTTWTDPCSSGHRFDGWRGLRRGACQIARTWLLRVGWRRGGLLAIDAVPGP